MKMMEVIERTILLTIKKQFCCKQYNLKAYYE